MSEMSCGDHPRGLTVVSGSTREPARSWLHYAHEGVKRKDQGTAVCEAVTASFAWLAAWVKAPVTVAIA